MSHLKALKSASSIADIARILGFKTSALAYLLYKKPETERYKSFQIPKRYGGVRDISAPCEEFKLLQRRLADVLQNCIEEADELQGWQDKMVHGFRRQRSIVTNATRHRRKRYVFNLDLADFFGTINFGRVRGFLIKDRSFALSPEVATILAQISIFKNELPQGAPTSPVLSNLIGRPMDVRLAKLAKQYGCTYTRYADDITFSTNLQEFPRAIASRDPNNNDRWMIGKNLANSINKCGFAINPSKTRMRYRDSRQEVTGLVVNEFVNVNSDFRKLVRAMVNQYCKTGEYFEVMRTVDDSRKVIVTKEKGNPQALLGRLAFIDHIRTELTNTPAGIRLKDTRYNISEDYRRFLFFREFYQTDRPVILCEGPTDIIYLSHAIHSLAPAFPSLINKDSSGKVSLSVRLYKYENRTCGKILGLSGGFGPLCDFVGKYKVFTESTQVPSSQFPVILIFDNDKGANKIKVLAKKLTGMELKEGDFIHLFSNLYAMLTPTVLGKPESAIEDLFDATTLAIPFGGKTFDPKDKTDKTKHFGKAVFAHKVIRPMASSISFAGFSPLLSTVCAAIEHRKKLLRVE